MYVFSPGKSFMENEIFRSMNRELDRSCSYRHLQLTYSDLCTVKWVDIISIVIYKDFTY